MSVATVDKGSSHPSRASALLGSVAIYLLLAALVVLLPGRALLLPEDELVAEILVSFVPQYLGIALAGAVFFLWRRRWLRGVAFTLLVIPDLTVMARPLWAASAEAGDGKLLATVTVANLAETPDAVAAVLGDLAHRDPDLLWLVEFPGELPPETAAQLAALERRYPYGVAWPAGEGRGLRFFSRFPVLARQVFNPTRTRGRPAIRLELDARGVALTVYALHTHPPTSRWSLAARNETLEWVEAQLRADGGNAVVIGDLNTSAFSPRFHELVRRGGLQCASPWHCAVGSWPAPILPLLTPIDHVLARGGVTVIERERGEHTGSDHFPVHARLGYRHPPVGED